LIDENSHLYLNPHAFVGEENEEIKNNNNNVEDPIIREMLDEWEIGSSF
jgi:hypothetical protein